MPYFDFKGYRYRQIHLDGAMANDVFDGLLSLDDPNGRIRFQGKVAHLLSLLEKRKQTRVAVDASLTVDNASLSRLQLSDALGARVLSLAARIQGNASSLDDLNGLLELKNFLSANLVSRLSCPTSMRRWSMGWRTDPCGRIPILPI